MRPHALLLAALVSCAAATACPMANASGLPDEAYTNITRRVVSQAQHPLSSGGSLEGVWGKVDMYAAEVPEGGRGLVPGGVLKSFTFAPVHFAKSNEWVSVDLSLAWNRGVFLGIQWWSCSPFGMRVATTESSVPRQVFSFNALTRQWEQCFGNYGVLGTVRALALTADGHPHPRDSVPPSWTCAPAAYTDNVCSCNCGEWDPASPHWNASVCDTKSYWAYDGCQCECGGDPDPDCFDPYAPVAVCSRKDLRTPFCAWSYGVASKCTGKQWKVASVLFADPSGVAERWGCAPERFNDGKVCDCECGMMDPDCLVSSIKQTSCRDNWRCVDGTCAVPPRWFCDSSNYNDSQYCDCNCGDYDPDCDQKVGVFNCKRKEQQCGYNGQCVQPVCGDLKVVAEEECDGDRCDGVPGCDNRNCTCQREYRRGARFQNVCIPDSVADSKKTAVIAGSVGGSGGFLLLVVIAAAIVYVRKAKYGPRPLNMPVELAGPAATFVTSDPGLECTGSPQGSSPAGAETAAVTATPTPPFSAQLSGGSGGQALYVDSQGHSFVVSSQSTQMMEVEGPQQAAQPPEAKVRAEGSPGVQSPGPVSPAAE
eukprot:m51a1_g7721 hypothetical protein (594) ;mRNA; r:144197-147148